MSKTFVQKGTGSQATLEGADESKIPIYATKAAADADLANLAVGQIVGTKDGNYNDSTLIDYVDNHTVTNMKNFDGLTLAQMYALSQQTTRIYMGYLAYNDSRNPEYSTNHSDTATVYCVDYIMYAHTYDNHYYIYNTTSCAWEDLTNREEFIDNVNILTLAESVPASTIKFIRGGSGCTNSPVVNGDYHYVITSLGGQWTQIKATDVNGNWEYIRTKSNGVWDDWKQLSHKGWKATEFTPAAGLDRKTVVTQALGYVTDKGHDNDWQIVCTGYFTVLGEFNYVSQSFYGKTSTGDTFTAYWNNSTSTWAIVRWNQSFDVANIGLSSTYFDPGALEWSQKDGIYTMNISGNVRGSVTSPIPSNTVVATGLPTELNGQFIWAFGRYTDVRIGFAIINGELVVNETIGSQAAVQQDYWIAGRATYISR